MSIKQKIHTVIFGTDTPAGKLFDIALLIAIVINILLMMIETVRSISEVYGTWFVWLDRFFLILFSVEFLLRLYSSPKPIKYWLSFFGLIDFLSLLPSYLTLFFSGSKFLMIIRSLRLLRVFRILHLSNFMNEATNLGSALRASSRKIIVFLVAVLAMVLVVGTLMYIIEGGNSGFTSIPKSIYWAIVTVTTVGYGDIAPATILGQTIASVLMLLGYGIIAVPTGIVSAELSGFPKKESSTCTSCHHIIDSTSRFCSQCGSPVTPVENVG